MLTAIREETAALTDEFAAVQRGAGLGLKQKAAVRSERKRPRLGVPVALILLLIVVSAAVFMRLERLADERTPAAGASAEKLADVKPVLFRYAFTAGQTRTYDISMDMSVTPHDAKQPAGFDSFTRKLSGTLTIDTVKEKADGSAVLDVAVSDIRAPSTISTAPMQGSKMRLTVAPDGRVLYAEATNGSLRGANPGSLVTGNGLGSDGTDSQFLFPRYSADAVKPGESWKETSSYPLPYADAKIDATARGTHNGYTDSAYGKAAKLRYSIEAPLHLDLAMAELSKAAQTYDPGSDPIAGLPGLENARVRFFGRMSMDADMLVLPEGSDLVSLIGTMNTSIRMGFANVPASALQGQPTEVWYDVTMKLRIVRSNGAAI